MLGHFLAYRKDHLRVFHEAHQRLGHVFSLRLGPQRAVVLIGPDHHRFFFTQVDGLLSVPEIYRFVIPMFGPVLNAAEDPAERAGQLSLLRSAFARPRMERHVRVMVRETCGWLDALGAEGEFEVYEALSRLGMNIAAAALMGPQIRRQMERFVPLFDDLARGMDFVLPPNLPLPRFRRRDRARRALTEMVRPVIAERLRRPGDHDDFLEDIIRWQAQKGQPEAEEVAGLALMTMFTGYIATAAQLTWSLIQLLQHPEVLERVCAEGDRVLGGVEAPGGAELDRMDELDRALMESERMHPVMSHYARYNAREYHVGPYRAPAGWLTMVCPAVAHRLPRYFKDPDTYDPDRFGPQRAEHRRHPFALIPFGGGAYHCPGASFGTYEMKCVVGLLLQRYALELPADPPVQDFSSGIMRPRPPFVLRYRERARLAPRRPAPAVAYGLGARA